MRLLVTADLHYNHGRSKLLAEEVIDRMNQAGGDVLLVVGDTASFDGDALERCLERFQFAGPKLLVAGNHELWTYGADSYRLFHRDLPARARAMGWKWLQDEPFVDGDLAIVGSMGWYDYSFAAAHLGIPARFYANKVSPGAARRFDELSHLFNPSDDIAPEAMEIVARWNDGRYIHLGRSDAEFLEEQLGQLRGQLDLVREVKTVIAAVHHLAFREMLPPSHNAQWDFAKAYLGSGRMGEVLLRYPNVKRLFSGHSHFPVEMTIGNVEVVNIGSGYRWKTFWVGEI